MLRRRWSKFFKPEALPGPSEAPQTPGIHVYLFWSKDGEAHVSHTDGDVTAEELCIRAAEVVGINPLCHALFALYNPQTRYWYSPNHTFSPEENCSLVLQYCMRFYFRNWHGLNDKAPLVSRHTLKSGTNQKGSTLLDITSLEYLFSQAKHQFVNEVVQMKEVQSEEERSRFKNESLGMAVLHLSHIAIQTNSTLPEVAGKVSFLQCIPRSFAKNISNDNFLTKIRIRLVFAQFVRTFQQHTVDSRKVTTQEIMYKYISTLEQLAPRFGSETFQVTSLKLREDGDGSSSYSSTVHGNGLSKENLSPLVTHEVMVSGTEGVKWRKLQIQRAQENSYLRNDYLNYKKVKQLNANTPDTWTLFSDFPDITHIAISEANVYISTLDNRCMVVQMNSSQEARSFVSLLDGYYRLTADAHHYLCREVAPPRVILSEANLLHGPMHEEFVLHKLKKDAAEEGAFLIRWSAIDYHSIILAVLKRNENGSPPSHKQFRIQQKGSVFCMEGWDREFSSVKEFIDNLKTFVLKSGSDSFMVKKCLLPKQAEISNLLVKRQSDELYPLSESFSQKLTKLRFNRIKEKNITPDVHLGRGTRTNIYSGRLLVGGEDDGDDVEFNNNSSKQKGIRVVLKILDRSHEDIALAFFETASLMSKVSHSHLVFVHGVSVKGSENIMVEEFVEFGPLDVFLRKRKASVNAQWKFIVSIQLASALSYLEAKQLVHGNVCAKNILVARRGLEHGTTPFIKLSDPGISLNALTREERLDRIPWIAPECVDTSAPIGQTADQWSFGITLLEICNNGDVPMSGSTLPEKELFYQEKQHLTEPSSEELARFINMCLTYEPEERPSFRTVLRELTEMMMKSQPFRKDIDILYTGSLSPPIPSTYQKRYLKKIMDLGEGHFGKVTLYKYDPTNDDTGELVAVKVLKQDDGYMAEDLMKEIEVLKSLDHTNIVRYKGCCTDPGRKEVQLIMEYLPMGSLRDYLPKTKVSACQCLMYAQQICQGMDYLHSKRYVHRDLAARNILVENNSLVKIGDFGLTKYIPEGDIYYRIREGGDSPVFWYAIECLKDNKFSFASDVWSFGVTLYEILTRCDNRQSPPTKFYEMMGKAQEQMTAMAIVDLLMKNRRLPCPRDCPHEVRLLMEQCWLEDQGKRPSFENLIVRFEAIRRTYDWQFSSNFTMSEIC
ncbi:non-receptor tyrosine-protein kinase TYK2 isoform X1 [Oryzias melastigma]|uniref:Tyrosine-protein kinase n=1 Tax=Oryzias melastigma TaxID=30732 RepID=A0A3B3CVA8_ORYME|nr:non-receptor tyrosine-protein kinase TYK2 isoform X1 [Oryzias melastigma]XP_036069102.1 non-receptor tyrosine-protein kinase TYK2 isoform X1 [Oryzias melastigma]